MAFAYADGFLVIEGPARDSNWRLLAWLIPYGRVRHDWTRPDRLREDRRSSLVHDRQLSPDVLAEIVQRFGGRSEHTAEGRARFPLRYCTAVARIRRERDAFEYVPVEVVDLGVCGVGFKIHTLVVAGSLLNIELRVPGLAPQTWHCRVVHVYAFDGTYYHVGAAFETVENV